MRKLILFILSFIIIISDAFIDASTVNAACQCVSWESRPYRCTRKGKEGWCSRSVCAAEDCGVFCGPGQYGCNRGCCDVGQVNNCECGTKPNGSCQSCEDEPAPPPAPSPSPPPPSCTVSLSPPSMTISQHQSADLIASVTPQNGSVSSVNFSSGNAAIASVNPASDTTYSYQTSVTGVAGGATSINTSVIMSGASRCAAAAINIIPIGPWWQVKDGNIHSSSGIFSDIPSGCSGGCIPSLMTGVSGLASYLGTLGVGGGTLSQSGANWQAETVYTGTYRLKPQSFPGTARHYSPRHLRRTACVAVQASEAEWEGKCAKHPVDRAAYRKYLLHRGLY